MAGPVLAILTAIVAAMTATPAIPIAHGLVRVCDFPRLQIAGIAVLLIVSTLAFLPIGPGALLLLAVQISTAAAQAAICLRFTPLWRVQSLPFKGASDDPSVVRILAANVKMSNRAYSKLLQLMREHDPHIAALMETDDQWLSALTRLKERLPFAVEQPQATPMGWSCCRACRFRRQRCASW